MESFRRLPELVEDVLPLVEVAISDPDWRIKDSSLVQIADVYERYMITHRLLTPQEIRDHAGTLRRMGWCKPDDIFGRWVSEDWEPDRML